MKLKRMVGMLIIAAAVLFSSTGAAPSAYKYKIKIYSDEASICVGQSTGLTVYYIGSVKGQTEKSKPNIQVTVTKGTVSPPKSTGGLGSGFVPFVFTANESGDAVIVALETEGGTTDSMTIKVEKECKYTYNLIITMTSTSNDSGVKFKWKAVTSSAGTFPATEPSPTTNTAGEQQLAPLHPLVPLKEMKMEISVMEVSYPPNDECKVPATIFTPKTKIGTVAVEGEVDKYSNSGVMVTFYDPKVNASLHWVVPCKHKNGTGDAGLDTSGAASPWIQETFPPFGGTRQIKNDLFQKWVDNINRSKGYTTGNYTAVLTVARVK